MIERAAYLGGCDSVAVDLAARRIGIPASGTLPHALVLILGSTAEATKAFDEVIDPSVDRTILIDTFDDEKFGALIAAEAIPDSIFAVRLDTPGNRRGDFRDLMQEVRWELDRAGYQHVKIFGSGGIEEEDILHLNPVCDAYGVGGSIAAAPMIDYSLDIVEVDGKDRSKRGKTRRPQTSPRTRRRHARNSSGRRRSTARGHRSSAAPVREQRIRAGHRNPSGTGALAAPNRAFRTLIEDAIM